MFIKAQREEKCLGSSPREETRDKEKYLERHTPKLLTSGRIKLLKMLQGEKTRGE